jgi:hypothetical protein
MNTYFVRRISTVLLIFVTCLYLWLSLRAEPRLATIPIIPHAVGSHFDLKPLQRSFPAFFALAVLAAGSVAGSRRRTQFVVLLACLSTPLIKDAMQIGLATRHFNCDAIVLGMLGALVGFSATYCMLSMTTSPRLSTSAHEHQQ